MLKLFNSMLLSNSVLYPRYMLIGDWHMHCLYMVRAATGESWQKIMMDCSRKESKCAGDSDSAGDSCGTLIAVPYFISFYILCSFLVSIEVSHVIR